MRRIFVTTIVTALCATPAAFAIACIGFAAISRALAAEAPKPLQLEAKIALGEVAGRIDHMAVDTERRRLFVAELGNNTLGVVDLVERRLLQRLTGLREPQGVGYDPSADIVYVANARDGSVHLFHGPAYTPKATIALGADADNIRIDPTGHRVIVGYGQGALAVIDAATQGRVRDIHLPQHPEGFQLDPETNRIFVNLPDERAVAVVDAAEGKLIATWPQTGRSGNFPMALDPVRRQVLAVFRNPALLAVLAMADGAPKAKVPSALTPTTCLSTPGGSALT
jgi:DNA-binding beta-propeller fold protein YncE